jgi:hypothetical protein
LEYLVESNSDKTRRFLDAMMPSLISQLKLTNSKRAVLVKVCQDIPKGMMGATLHIAVADCYLVLLRPPKRLTPTNLIYMATSLTHEMVHVRQLAKGQMKFLKNEARVWMGKRYKATTPYLDQPWEVDAFSKQELLLRRAIE